MRTFSLNDRDAQILNGILGSLNNDKELAEYITKRSVEWRPSIKEHPVLPTEVRHVINGMFLNTIFK